METRVGYRQLIRANRDFRNLWFGQVVSEVGDWFSTVAIFNLLLELTGRAQAVGWFLIVIHLPSVFVGPFSGILVDRFNRKRLMILMDLLRAGLVLVYLLIKRADQVWIVYVIAALEVAMLTIFEPARTACVPNLCTKAELVAANALSSVTWSIMLTIGAAFGGFVTAIFGREFAFVVDSLSFIGSALFIRRVRLPGREAIRTARGTEWGLEPSDPDLFPGIPLPSSAPDTNGRSASGASGAPQQGLRGIIEGFRYVRERPPVLALLLVKTGWCLGGGLLLILSVFGQTIFPVMGNGAAGIGVLFAARGIGTAIGPIAARRISGEQSAPMRAAIASGFLMGAVSYVLFGQAPTLWTAALALMIGHMGGSITWVFSTVLLQMEVPDAFRGRVFATEFALLTLAIAISNYFAGYGLDVLRLSPRTVASLVGVYFFFPALAWRASQKRIWTRV